MPFSLASSPTPFVGDACSSLYYDFLNQKTFKHCKNVFRVFKNQGFGCLRFLNSEHTLAKCNIWLHLCYSLHYIYFSLQKHLPGADSHRFDDDNNLYAEQNFAKAKNFITSRGYSLHHFDLSLLYNHSKTNFNTFYNETIIIFPWKGVQLDFILEIRNIHSLFEGLHPIPPLCLHYILRLDIRFDKVIPFERERVSHTDSS